jgi:hypothetical protein
MLLQQRKENISFLSVGISKKSVYEWRKAI